MADLFISYSSHDRDWAERLYNDLKRAYPTLDIFWDYTSIRPAANWRQILTDMAQDAQNLVSIWSEAAKGSNEVGPEIQAFLQNRNTRPVLNDLGRQMYYVPLEGDYGPLTAIQGFPAMRTRAAYSAVAPDRGMSSLQNPAVLSDWKRIVRMIGDDVARPGVRVTLAVLAMNSTLGLLDHLDTVEHIRTLPGRPTLNELLTSLGLTLTNVKTRYGLSAFEWKPYGTPQTVIDILQDLRADLNGALDRAYQFSWSEVDLLSRSFEDQAVEPVLKLLSSGPAVLVLDPISLHNPTVKAFFDQLGDYFKREDAMVVAPSPIQAPGLEPLLLTLDEKGANILRPYFKPYVPASGTFAGCGLNLGHKIELARVVRHGLGLYHLRKKKQDEEALVKMRPA